MDLGKYVFFNGKFIAYKQASLPLATHALHYGTGCFEGIRAYWNQKEKQLYLFKGLEHYQRMQNSVKILFGKLPYSSKKLVEITLKLLKKNNHKADTYIRPLYFKSEETIGKFNLAELKDSFFIYTASFGRYLGDLSCGLNVAVSSWRRVDDNAIPARAKITGAYVNTALAKNQALMDGYNESIFLTNDGHVCEGSAENIFMVKNGKVITPPVTDNILEGITRNTLIYLFKEELGIQVEERSIDKTELYVASEAFFCGTGAEVTPIASVDKRKLGEGKIGPLTQKIQKVFLNIVQGKKKKYQSWLLPVY